MTREFPWAELIACAAMAVVIGARLLWEMYGHPRCWMRRPPLEGP
jgi:hypothetical protein